MQQIINAACGERVSNILLCFHVNKTVRGQFVVTPLFLNFERRGREGGKEQIMFLLLRIYIICLLTGNFNAGSSEGGKKEMHGRVGGGVGHCTTK